MFTEIEKENLELLKFACAQKGVLERKYHFGLDRDFEELRKDFGLEDKICLLKREDTRWDVCYVEKGQKSSTSIHTKLFDAAGDAWRRLTLEKGPWKYFQAFKQEKDAVGG